MHHFCNAVITLNISNEIPMFSFGIWRSPERYFITTWNIREQRHVQRWAESLDSAHLEWGSLASLCSLPALFLIIWDQQNLWLVDLRDKHSDHHPTPLLIRLMAQLNLLNLERKSELLPKSKPEESIKPIADTNYCMAKKRRTCISQLNEGREHERLTNRRETSSKGPLCKAKGSRN